MKQSTLQTQPSRKSPLFPFAQDWFKSHPKANILDIATAIEKNMTPQAQPVPVTQRRNGHKPARR